MPETSTLPESLARPRLNHDTSQRLRFFSLLSMVLLVFVHGYNLNERYLQSFTFVQEPLTFNTFFQYLTANGLFRFRIPMLFAISGYLFAMSDYRPNGERALKRLRTLGLPYLIWSAIGLLVVYLWELSPYLRQAALDAGLQGDKIPIDQYEPSRLIDTWIFNPYPFQLWFLKTLLILNLLYPLIAKAIHRAPTVYFWCAGVLWVWGLLISGVAYFIPGFLGHVFGFLVGNILEGEGLFYFSIGIWLCKTSYSLDRLPFGWSLTTWVSLFLGLSILKTGLAFQSAHLPEFPLALALHLLHKAVVFTGFVAAWFGLRGFADRAMRMPIVSWACGFAFIIYGLHEPVLHFATNVVFEHFQNVAHYRVLTYLLLPTTIIVVCIAIGATLRAVWPKGYSVLTGGRGLA